MSSAANPAAAADRLGRMLREAAEYPNSFVPLGPGEERIETSRYTLCMSESRLWNTVQRQRFARDEVDDVLTEIRSLLRQRGRTSTQWEVGSMAEPADLVSRLLERGLVHDRDPVATALALRAEPSVPPAGLLARRVQTREEYVAASEVQFDAFEPSPEEIADRRATFADGWNRSSRIMHVVWLDGEIVAAGTCAWTPYGLALFGGATLVRARGRGAYRALIHARWRETAGEAQRTLITQAGIMSQPILQRLGFEPVGRVDMLLDRFRA